MKLTDEEIEEMKMILRGEIHGRLKPDLIHLLAKIINRDTMMNKDHGIMHHLASMSYLMAHMLTEWVKVVAEREGVPVHDVACIEARTYADYVHYMVHALLEDEAKGEMQDAVNDMRSGMVFPDLPPNATKH